MAIGKTTQPIKDLKKEQDLIGWYQENDKEMYMLALIIRFTAFRVSDIYDLRVRDVLGDYLEIEEKKTLYLKEKYEEYAKRVNKKPLPPKPPRKVLLHPTLKKEIQEYIKDKKNYEVLFPSPRGKNNPLCYSQINRRMLKGAKQVGIDNFGTHALRKTCLWRMYIKTKDIAAVQHFAGHKSIKDTSKYLGLDQELNDKLVLGMDSPL